MGTPASAHTFDLSERMPAVVSVVRLPNFAGADRRSVLVDAVWDVLEEQTLLEPSLLNEQLVSDCLVRRRSEQLLCQTLSALNERPDEAPSLLIFVVGVGLRHRSQVEVGFLDLDAAREARGQMLASGLERTFLGDEARWSAFVDAVAGLTTWDEGQPADSEGELRQALMRVVTRGPLRSALAEKGLIKPQGEVLLMLKEPLHSLTIDGRRLAIGADGSVLVSGLGPGRHEFLGHTAGRSWRREVDVPAEGTVQATIRSAPFGRVWDASLVASGALLVASAGVAVAGVLEAENRPPPFSSGMPWIRVSARPGSPSDPAATIGEGPLFVGLASGLAATGATALLLSTVARDEERLPWVELLLAVATGVAVSAAFELSNP